MTYNENGSIADKEVTRFTVLRHQDHRAIHKETGCGMTTIRSVLDGIQSAQTEKGKRIVASAEKILKSKK